MACTEKSLQAILALLAIMAATPVVSFRSIQPGSPQLAPCFAAQALARVSQLAQRRMCCSALEGQQGGEQVADASVKEGKRRLLEVGRLCVCVCGCCV